MRPLHALITALTLFSPNWALGIRDAETVKRNAESKVRNIVEPLINKFCGDPCKILAITADAKVAVPDELAPGFEDISVKRTLSLEPASVKVKLLIDDMVGPISRGKLLDLIREHTGGDVLSFPVFIQTKVAHFPQPLSSAKKVAELRNRISEEFQEIMKEIIRQFCPQQCMLADYDIRVDQVNPEEAQYGSPGQFRQEGGTAVKINRIGATVLLDNTLTTEEQTNIIEMAKLKTNHFKNVKLTGRTLKFPHPIPIEGEGGYGYGRGKGRKLAGDDKTRNLKKESKLLSDSKSKFDTNTTNTNRSENSLDSKLSRSEDNTRSENFERYETIERVEDGDAVQKELEKFKVFGLIFAAAIMALLVFIAMGGIRRKSGGSPVQKILSSFSTDHIEQEPRAAKGSVSGGGGGRKRGDIAKRYEIEELKEELSSVYAEHPKVAKQTFTRVIREEGVEVTAQYIHIFGESIVLDILKDPSLQGDLSELMEFYAKNTFELTADEELELLRALHNRTVAAKMVVFGSRSSGLFEFLVEMDGMQIVELFDNESVTVKAIVMTQIDTQKRQAIYAHMPEDQRMQLLTELSRIDHLPKDYITNVAAALRRKREENPRLNTEALPGSDVLVNLLEKTDEKVQKQILKGLEQNNPDSARAVKSKLVSLETLPFLRDSQLLEVVLSLRHDELLQFLKGAPQNIRDHIFAKSPKDLVSELEEELESVGKSGRETYQVMERKVLSRIKVLSQEGALNLVEINDRMFAARHAESFSGRDDAADQDGGSGVKKVQGW